ncbi:DUF1003 domain-containing protein [Nostoc sp.]|uniref:DUF1003 domain-containing protein n=1 Tax=Nostoc sp. TaxID=1180 RepID=UPI002FF80F81
MNPAKSSTSNVNTQKQLLEKVEANKSTLGQRVADAMAARVGSWSFLIGQSTVLAAWVGLNLTPGVPHWDQSPFILLNLVFSFASAYTAPIVLMSQNRQSDIEREKNEYDHLVNCQAAQNIELLHEKLDTLQAQQIQELTQIVKQQQQALNEIKASVLPTIKEQQQFISEIKVGVLPGLKGQNNSKLPKEVLVYLPFNFEKSKEDNS